MSGFDDLPPGPVESLTCSTLDGKPYKRSAAVERQIGGMLSIPESEWESKLRHAYTETLVHLIRFARRRGLQIYSELFIELSRRTTTLAEQWSRGLPATEKEEVVAQIACEIMELAVSLESTRQTEFLEMAFVEAVQARSVGKFRVFEREAQRRDSFVPQQFSEDEDEIARPQEYLPDRAPEPETMALLRNLLNIASNALDDKRYAEAAYLHYGEGWPILSTNPKTSDLCRRFNATEGQIKQWLKKAMPAMREALAAAGIKSMSHAKKGTSK